MAGLIETDDQTKVADAMARVLDRDASGASIELSMRTGDGDWRWVENRYVPIRDKDRRLVEVEGIIIDITERKAAEEKITLLARTDSLTGLANRSAFLERLRQAFAAADRGGKPFAIVYLDLDHFKPINDTLGHPIGDLLLRQVADRRRGSTKESDLVARLGVMSSRSCNVRWAIPPTPARWRPRSGRNWRGHTASMATTLASPRASASAPTPRRQRY